MGHNANTVLLGTTRSNLKDVGNRNGTIDAGKIVRLKSDGTISLLKADGLPLGISLGKDLSDIGRTAIAYKGNEVPLRLGAAFTPAIGAVVYISDTTGMGVASATDATAVNAVYKTSLLADGALTEDGSSSVACAMIDFPGGL